MKTTIQSILRGSACLLAATLAASLAAQTTDTTSGSTTASTPANTDINYPRSKDDANVKHHDRAFLEKAAKGGMKEVAVSEAVAGRLTNAQVRGFADQMVKDHTDVNNQVMALAAQKGVTLPDMTKKDEKLNEKWSDKGGDLDKKYIKEMIEDHEETVKLFEKAAKSDDADIASFAQKTLPSLQHHLGMAKDIKKNNNL